MSTLDENGIERDSRGGPKPIIIRIHEKDYWFPSGAEAARRLNIHPGTVQARCANPNNVQFRYARPDETPPPIPVPLPPVETEEPDQEEQQQHEQEEEEVIVMVDVDNVEIQIDLNHRRVTVEYGDLSTFRMSEEVTKELSKKLTTALQAIDTFGTPVPEPEPVPVEEEVPADTTGENLSGRDTVA